MKTDKQMRSIVKAFSWRMLATLTTFVISFIVTHSINFAFSISIIEVFSKLLLYYLHERSWQYLSFWQYKPEVVENANED
jgi:uncharacterized membrane protein